MGDPRVDAVSFTGSLAVGRQVATLAAPHFTRIQLELGSKNALAAMDDAELDLAVEAAIHGAYSETGQKCTASSRLVVLERVHDALVERLASRARAPRVGHALDDDTEIDPSPARRSWPPAWHGSNARGAKAPNWLPVAKHCSFAPAAGTCHRPCSSTRPTIMSFDRKQLFGPIVSVICVGSYDEALSVTNDTEDSLLAGIVTRFLARASHFRRHAEAG